MDSSGGVEVVIVDDEPMIPELLADLLPEDMPRKEFTHPAKALAYLSDTDHPVVLIVDLRMPGMGGIELIKYLRKMRSADSMFVVLLTGHMVIDLDEEARKLMEHVPVIKKPWHTRDLEKQVPQWIEALKARNP